MDESTRQFSMREAGMRGQLELIPPLAEEFGLYADEEARLGTHLGTAWPLAASARCGEVRAWALHVPVVSRIAGPVPPPSASTMSTCGSRTPAVEPARQ